MNTKKLFPERLYALCRELALIVQGYTDAEKWLESYFSPIPHDQVKLLKILVKCRIVELIHYRIYIPTAVIQVRKFINLLKSPATKADYKLWIQHEIIKQLTECNIPDSGKVETPEKHPYDFAFFDRSAEQLRLRHFT